LVFVPLLISDAQNYRVGYGKGFYDRFLSNCRKDCKKIGLNFFKPIAKINNIDQFDIALDDVIYPNA
jgi:5-formyltetrahydrofolate cyclo-ligase